MEIAELTALEDEMRRDLEAITRVRRLLEAKNGSLRIHTESKVQPQSANELPTAHTEVVDQDESPVTTLRGKIEQVITADPAARWTTQKMLAHLQRTGFPLNAKKPVYSIGQSLNILANQGRIRIIRKGAGSKPNIYRANESMGKADNSQGWFVEPFPTSTPE